MSATYEYRSVTIFVEKIQFTCSDDLGDVFFDRMIVHF
ncbi:hypothetical protein ES703_59166 [subsurface metagenome]